MGRTTDVGDVGVGVGGVGVGVGDDGDVGVESAVTLIRKKQ